MRRKETVRARHCDDVAHRGIAESPAERERGDGDAGDPAGELREHVGQGVDRRHLAEPEERQGHARIEVRPRSLSERRIYDGGRGESHRDAHRRAPQLLTGYRRADR